MFVLNNIISVLKENPFYFYTIIGASVILILLIVTLIIVKVTRKKADVSTDERFIKETLKEEPVSEEEKAPKKAVVKEEKVSKEEPVVEETTEEEVQEEVVEEETSEEETTEEDVQEETTEKKRVVNGKYLVYFDGTNYFYVLKASNGEVLINSELYSSKDGVLQAIDAIKRNVKVGRIEISCDKHGLYQFALFAKNNRKLVYSSNYTTEKRAISASNSFKRFAETSVVPDEIIEVEPKLEEIEIERVSKRGGRLGVLETEGGFYYLLKASNGEILARSNVYKTFDSASKALERFKVACNEGKFIVSKDKRGLYQYKLYSTTNRVIIAGEAYETKAQAISSANSAYSFVEFAMDFDKETI